MNTGNNTLRTNKIEKAGKDEIIAATYYEEKFVPTLFGRWSAIIVKTAQIKPGQNVLDVACGSGVVTRDIAKMVGRKMQPSGVDISAGMIEVARSIMPEINWRVGDAMALPYADNQFDRVVCQFGLMFFPDRVQALREMLRVLKPEGRIAVSVWNSLDNNPGFATKVNILQNLAGTQAADALRAPFCLGNPSLLEKLATEAGLQGFDLVSHAGEACFDNLREFVDAELRGWLPIMDVHLDEPLIDTIYQECRNLFATYSSTNGGEFVMPTSAHVFTGYGTN